MRITSPDENEYEPEISSRLESDVRHPEGRVRMYRKAHKSFWELFRCEGWLCLRLVALEHNGETRRWVEGCDVVLMIEYPMIHWILTTTVP